jgi:glycosyltransferase involved in cell wall biosynthesis
MVSIIITVYKNDSFLYDTLDSINKSNVNFDYEILLGVDNCQITMDSIKNNLDKISENIKVFLFPKVGTYVIRNSLSKISKFDNLLFVDSDDILTEYANSKGWPKISLR